MYTFFCAVWRHVLGSNDAIDGLDIALGKCNDANIHLVSAVFTLFFSTIEFGIF